MRLFVLLPCFILGVMFPLSAQETSLNGGGGYFKAGYTPIQTNDLRPLIPDQAGDIALNDNHLSLGGGGYFVYKDFQLGLYGFGISGSAESNSTFEVQTQGGVGVLKVGYYVLKGQYWSLVPKLGVGWSNFGLEIHENRDLPLSAIQQDPGRAIEASQEGLVLDGSLEGEFYPFTPEDKPVRAGLLLTLEVGYRYQFQNGDWSYEGGQIQNGPEFNLQGPYVSIGIGGIGLRAVDPQSNQD